MHKYILQDSVTSEEIIKLWAKEKIIEKDDLSARRKIIPAGYIYDFQLMISEMLQYSYYSEFYINKLTLKHTIYSSANNKND